MRSFLVPGLVAGLLLSATPAAADDVAGVVRASALNDTQWGAKGATAICPLGKHLMGAGFQVGGETNTVVIDDLVPNETLTTVAAMAYGPNGSWTMTTYAVCAFFQPGQQRMSADSPGDGGEETATATCPGSKVLVGAGYRISGALGAAKVYRLRPNGGSNTAPNSVTVSAAGTPTRYTVTAYANCVDPSEGLVPGLVRRQTTTVGNSDFGKSVSSPCAAGEVLIGTGYEVHNAPGMVVVNGMRPNGSATAGPTSLIVSAYKAQNFPTDWSLSAYALCAV